MTKQIKVQWGSLHECVENNFENFAMLLIIQFDGNASKLDHSTQIDTLISPIHHNLTLHHILVLFDQHFNHAQF